MRILLLTYSYLPNLGGVERSIANLSSRLAANGHEVTIATHRRSAVPLRYDSSDAVAILHLHIPSPDRSAWWRRAATAFLDVWNEAVLTTLCLLRRIEIVHAHHLNAGTSYGRVLSRLLGIPFAITLRGGETEQWMCVNERRKAYLIENLEAADAVTAVSRGLIDHASRVAPSLAGRAIWIPNPVDPEEIAADASAAEADADAAFDAPVVLFAGRLEFMKDLECLIESFHSLLARDPHFPARLVLAGDGALAPSLRSLAATGAGSARIRFLGPRSHRQTLRLIRDARVLVLPSRCSEGCPNVVLEAMALDTPVIVSDLPSLTELVEDGANGRVFPVGDRRALARCITDLVSDKTQRARACTEARTRLLRSHSYDAVVGHYIELYCALTAAKSRRRR